MLRGHSESITITEFDADESVTLHYSMDEIGRCPGCASIYLLCYETCEICGETLVTVV